VVGHSRAAVVVVVVRRHVALREAVTSTPLALHPAATCSRQHPSGLPERAHPPPLMGVHRLTFRLEGVVITRPRPRSRPRPRPRPHPRRGQGRVPTPAVPLEATGSAPTAMLEATGSAPTAMLEATGSAPTAMQHTAPRRSASAAVAMQGPHHVVPRPTQVMVWHQVCAVVVVVAVVEEEEQEEEEEEEVPVWVLSEGWATCLFHPRVAAGVVARVDHPRIKVVVVVVAKGVGVDAGVDAGAGVDVVAVAVAGSEVRVEAKGERRAGKSSKQCTNNTNTKQTMQTMLVVPRQHCQHSCCRWNNLP